MSEIGHAKGSFLEALEGAEVDPASGMVQKSFMSVSDTDFGLGLGKLQHAVSDKLLKHHAKALGIRARKLPLDDQRRMSFLNQEDCPLSTRMEWPVGRSPVSLTADGPIRSAVSASSRRSARCSSVASAEAKILSMLHAIACRCGGDRGAHPRCRVLGKVPAP